MFNRRNYWKSENLRKFEEECFPPTAKKLSYFVRSPIADACPKDTRKQGQGIQEGHKAKVMKRV